MAILLWNSNLSGADGRRLSALAVSATAIFLLGLADDLWGVSSKIKLLGLILAAVLICASGSLIHTVHFGGYYTLDLGIGAWPVTILWIVGVAVAMNFIDGLDGLAAGIAAITAAAYAIAGLYTGNTLSVVTSVALLGSLCGFLPFNFNPARIFMGDGGSMFLGFVLAVCGIFVQTTDHPGSVLVPMLALSVPLLDMVLTMIRRRVLQRRSIFAAERGHIHHQLLDLGLSQKKAVLLLYAVSAAAASAGIVALAGRRWTVLALIAGTTFVLAFFQCCGAARVAETFEALSRNRRLGREQGGHRQAFEAMQIRFAAAESFDQWWCELCRAGELLEFSQLQLSMSNQGSMERVLKWTSEHVTGHGQHIVLRLPFQLRSASEPLRLEIVLAAASLESAGYRIALLTRLLSEQRMVESRTTQSSGVRPVKVAKVEQARSPADDFQPAYAGT
ncbi:MAG TPA: MraY family glycosyltransferase [Tepidisphaeraceae bacterium]